ncbi:thioesterase II family protein [Streptomyces sp. MUM 178J]|uniref:thioesterase II family protein n=1 Tax=Streptomyces sp. MUM 178J TaxID=2791991 RepID=UPI001F04A794|nr:alpha/beta fold hydrolase [Streptomyces sp. MUM 178J]WRQ80791.1 alpha/beta fold hydrolase [Streptomyces sp. MUM 178J]
MIPTAPPAPKSVGRWLRRPRPVANPRLRLVCLPHAGGTAGTFHGWADLLPADVELVAVQYPGRQDRLGEPCVTAMAELADGVAQALLPLLGRPLALFGHSMGAALAYEVTLRLETLYRARPRQLFVSGHAAPGSPRSSRDLHTQDDAAMVEDLLALGGMDEALTADPGLLPLLLPSMRADLKLIETYQPADARPVGIPLTAYVGDSDPGVPVSDAAAWSDRTSGDFDLRVFPGGHFYLAQQEAEVVKDITARLDLVG